MIHANLEGLVLIYQSITMYIYIYLPTNNRVFRKLPRISPASYIIISTPS